MCLVLVAVTPAQTHVDPAGTEASGLQGHILAGKDSFLHEIALVACSEARRKRDAAVVYRCSLALSTTYKGFVDFKKDCFLRSE